MLLFSLEQDRIAAYLYHSQEGNMPGKILYVMWVWQHTLILLLYQRHFPKWHLPLWQILNFANSKAATSQVCHSYSGRPLECSRCSPLASPSQRAQPPNPNRSAWPSLQLLGKLKFGKLSLGSRYWKNV